MKLVIVESPAKARTISRFLGRDFRVEASYGHVRDLPKTKFGVDEENDFEPTYNIIPKAAKRLKELEKVVKKADALILATDEDREGEAIAWHLTQALGFANSKVKSQKSKMIQRIVFHEITKNAIDAALKNPRDIDMKLVLAQQARRVLDRIVGYKLSPFLWKKVMRGLSAGRVQSVAVRLFVERENEIETFKPQEYWTVIATLAKSNSKNQKVKSFDAFLVAIGDTKLDKFAVKNESEAKDIVGDLEGARWQVMRIEKKEVRRNPLPPFTTSTMVAEAARRFGFSAKQTMLLAQQLYEGVELGEEGNVGLITYMRTDSTNIAEEAIEKTRSFIKQKLGDSYLAPSPRRFKTRSRLAQEAHEAIRPTEAERLPESVKPFLDQRQYKLYDLIWRRTVATQMEPAVFEATSVDIAAESEEQRANDKQYTFRATGSVLRFDGFLKIYPIKTEETILPPLEENERLELVELNPEQHFTEPPPRYSEATLVKTLEQYGIGRPSTYAPIISTIQERGYVEKGPDRRFRPTDIGKLVNNLLVEHFPEIVDYQFTAKMEGELDDIAGGKIEWVPVIREFYEPFMANLRTKEEKLTRRELTQEAIEELCPECAKPLVIKMGKYGRFIACTGYPECKYTRKLNQNNNAASLGLPCPECGEGEIVERRTRKRWRKFYGCSRYPACSYATWQDPRKETASTENK